MGAVPRMINLNNELLNFYFSLVQTLLSYESDNNLDKINLFCGTPIYSLGDV